MTWPFAFVFATILFLIPVRMPSKPSFTTYICLAAQWLFIVICYGLGIADLLGATIGGCR